MDLLDRYLQAVKKHLPWQRQDDIIAELRANLESQLEDKEAELGRLLTTPEMEAWLKQMGPPILVAGRYQTQRYLIGPAVFPIYSYVMQLALFWAVIIYSIVIVAQFFAGPSTDTDLVEALLRVPGLLVTVAAWVTAVFAALEFAVTRYPEKCQRIPGFPADWSPSTLPPVEPNLVPGKKRRTYAQAVAEVIFGFLFLCWLLLIPQHPYLLMGPGAIVLKVSPFQLATVWLQFFWWIVALNLLQLGWRCVNLWRGRWQQPLRAEQIAVSAMGLIPLTVVLTVRDHALVVLKHPALDQARYGATLDSINLWTYRGFLIIFLIAALQMAWVIGQMSLKAYREHAAGMR